MQHWETATKSFFFRRVLVLGALLSLVLVCMVARKTSAFAAFDGTILQDKPEIGPDGMPILPESEQENEQDDREVGFLEVDGDVLTDEDYNKIVEEMDREYKDLFRLNELFTIREGTEDKAGSLMWTLLESPVSPVCIGRKVIMVVGVALVLGYTAVAILKALQRSDTSMESFFRILALAVAGILIVVLSYDILKWIEQLGQILVQAVRDSVTKGFLNGADPSLGYAKKTIVEEAGDAPPSITDGFFRFIGFYIAELFRDIVLGVKNFFVSVWNLIYSKFHLLVMSLGLKITFYLILTSAYGLLFELVLRKIFLPVAMADLMLQGLRSPAVRYLKNHLGVYVRIAIFYILLYTLIYMEHWCAMASNHSTTLKTNTFLGAFGVILCVRMAIKSMINGSSAFAKEVLGG